ncbi:sigma-54 dependent transcriptional regulator [Leeia sp. TBRC 13508]|uniref:Sigma-54 dependent transcriptional regulator n=1 Tax=Leeia speluncae TaxID=2884804 RepID=A0ABS8DA11_9NEIS|nr:sigma-54 dependent transcriptional regulator [Leeia speluncae]MCB6185041.1 sigma-54 dependent transcriptional regulator [Leeia speluncae]
MQLITLPNAQKLSTSIRATALVFEDPKSRALHQHIELIAPSDATVLIIGETGTGKELIARHVHELSARKDKPFVAVNCGAFSETLVESELFGHEKGSFTGAVSQKAGWFEAANGGTIFLDEIGDLPLSMQVKLLRVLQEREVTRIGARHAIPINVRVIAATNVDLEEAVIAGNFREDLYYRLRVAELDLLPLCERTGDILPLANYFVSLYKKRLNIAEAYLSPSAEQKLITHSWPGNIRELENIIHHALLVSKTGTIQADDLHIVRRIKSPAANANVQEQRYAVIPEQKDPYERLSLALKDIFEDPSPLLYEKIDHVFVKVAYDYCHRNQLQTSRLLDLSRNIVRAKLIKYGELKEGKQRFGLSQQDLSDLSVA